MRVLPGMLTDELIGAMAGRVSSGGGFWLSSFITFESDKSTFPLLGLI